MTKEMTIAIDGPAASGKSTLGKSLAEALGLMYFDTGVMYRAVTLAALQRGISPGDEAMVSDLARQVTIDVHPPSKQDGRPADVLLDGEDCTWEIRTAQVDANVSVVSAFPEVRAALTEQQRRIGMRGGLVMMGRDIGTVVLPEADVKIFLDASVEERARRRHSELAERGVEADYAEVEESLRQRDKIDASRDVAPLVAAEDAHVLATDELSRVQVLERALALVANKRAGA